MRERRLLLVLVGSVLAATPRASDAAGVAPRFDLSAPEKGPFPSDRFTVEDSDQLSGRRVRMPLPDCEKLPSDCEELAIVNELDGFNLQPRLAIPFTGAIDPGSVSSATVFLVGLGDAVSGDGAGEVVGINQVVWDPPSSVLYAESDQLLRQHSRYVLIVTNGVRDAAGDPVAGGDFETFRQDLNFGQTHDKELKAYRKALLEALAVSRVPRPDVVAATVFTTLSATALSEKIRDQIKAAVPPAARFDIAANSRGDTVRAVFNLADIPSVPKNSGIRLSAQTSANAGSALTPSAVQLDEGRTIVPGALARIAFGKYVSKDYKAGGRVIPQVPTRTGVPLALDNEVYFNLLLPAGEKPAGGWPVAIYIHGTGANKETGMYAVAGTLAARGIATIAINGVGHGFGPRSTLTVTTATGTFTVPSGGRGSDQDGNGVIDVDEGLYAGRPVINRRDGDRQTVVDLMQLIRVIEIGMDVDGDGTPDLNPSHIHCLGNSMGGFLATILLAIEPGILVGSASAAGGSIIELARTGTRPLVSALLAKRTPNLMNALPAVAPLLGFNENMPLRNQGPLTNTVSGAIELQNFFERVEWVDQSGDPVAYAPHVRQRPLEGMPAKDIIVQLAKGDKTVPNPTNTALLRAGNLGDRATYYRYDLVFPTFDAREMAGLTGLTVAERTRAKNPHVFLTNFTNPPADRAPNSAAIAFHYRDLAVEQLAVFFASDGTVTIDPDGDGPAFETPIQGPLPEDFNFIP
jgi:pimeloyl-ACP methyl ester carboxylesterase